MFQRVPDTFWFADPYILSCCFAACDSQNVIIPYVYIIKDVSRVIYSHRLACMSWKTMIAARRCVATLVMLSRSDVVPLFYNRCEH